MNASLYPKFIMDDAVSPPPAILIASIFFSISHIFFVPLLNFSISKYPTGPFQIIVLLSFKYFLNSSIVSIPISKPISTLSILSILIFFYLDI